MKKVYDFFRKFYWLFLIGGFINIIFGTVAFALDYKNQQFVFPAVCSILFVVFLAASLSFAIFFAHKTKHLHITKIRKQSSNFLKLSTWLALAAITLLFIAETVKLVSKSYISDPSDFTPARIARYILCLPLIAYFLINALPSKIKKTKIVIPNVIKYILSVCSILWCLSGLLSAYFYEKLAETNMAKNWQIIIYLALTFFFLFEAKFEHLKPSNFAYVLSAFTSFLLVMSFSVTIIISSSLGFIPIYIDAGQNVYECFSAVENLVVFLLGLYAFARMHAVYRTMKHVMDNDEKGSFSSKFNKKPNDFATDSKKASQTTPTNEEI